jgi:NAD-dependent SIR2 family protein deacetylase
MDDYSYLFLNSSCAAVVRPDVVLFGEPMPTSFWTHIKEDFEACDLLLVFGTSLVVR